MTKETPQGYLYEKYRLFHLRDSRAQKIDSHYHDFDKLVLLLSGRVTYTVEGKRYFLLPGDILLVRHSMIHKPEISGREPYERMVLWIDKEYLATVGGESDLSACFETAHERNFHLLRGGHREQEGYVRLFHRLEEALNGEDFGHSVLADAYFLELLVALNRAWREDRTAELTGTYRYDPKMEELMRYIEENPAADLSVDALGAHFYLSRYYLMHRFKDVSGGHTLHRYVNQKRLQYACRLMREGESVLKAAEDAGFSDYSTFLRVFRAQYKISPREFRGKSGIEKEASYRE